MTPFEKLKDALQSIIDAKPNDRSGIDRRYAIVITMLEKAVVYFAVYIDGEVE